MCAHIHGVSKQTHESSRDLKRGRTDLGGGGYPSLLSARLPPSGVTACGVLWVEPGDPMTRRPSSIVLI